MQTITFGYIHNLKVPMPRIIMHPRVPKAPGVELVYDEYHLLSPLVNPHAGQAPLIENSIDPRDAAQLHIGGSGVMEILFFGVLEGGADEDGTWKHAYKEDGKIQMEVTDSRLEEFVTRARNRFMAADDDRIIGFPPTDVTTVEEIDRYDYVRAIYTWAVYWLDYAKEVQKTTGESIYFVIS